MSGVVYKPCQTLCRGDLDLFLTNPQDLPVNAAEIYYAIYYIDPGPPEQEVLIGDPHRVPMNPAVGEYYASLLVPPSATPGEYRIRWSFRQFVNSPLQQVVQEFGVVSPSTAVTPGYSQLQANMIWSLRTLLRDQCLGEEEEVKLNVDGEIMIVSLKDLYEAVNG
jgi:hypothetical protein